MFQKGGFIGVTSNAQGVIEKQVKNKKFLFVVPPGLSSTHFSSKHPIYASNAQVCLRSGERKEIKS